MMTITTAILMFLAPPLVTWIGMRRLMRVERYHTIMRMRRRRDHAARMRRHREFMRRFEVSAN